MYDISKIPERIKQIRKFRYLQYKNNPTNNSKYEICKSQEKLAEALNVERRTIIKWENGSSIPTIENLIALSDFLDCSLDYFLGLGDIPEADPIAKVSYYSKISAEIIKYGLENPDYLDCLNFFMLPKNCKSLFNNMTLCEWKKFWINTSIKNIDQPLKDKLTKIFNEFIAVTPFNIQNKKSYKAFLKSKLPQNSLVFNSKKTASGINIKASFNPLIYQNFFTNKEFIYSDFIDYLVDNTYEPLLQSVNIELQKEKLSKAFIDLFTEYLNSY